MIICDIIWMPAGPPLQIGAGAILLAVFAVAAYARSWRRQPRANAMLLAMRLAVIAALTLLLMGPSITSPREDSGGKPRLSILLDTSASMQVADCHNAARLDYAITQWLAPAQRQKLWQDYDVKLYGFDSQLTPLGEESLSRGAGELARGRTTRIADCVTRCLMESQGRPRGEAILLLSDGHDSEDSALAPAALLALARNTPIYTACLGGQTLQRDLALAAVPKQENLLAGEPGEIVVQIYQ